MSIVDKVRRLFRRPPVFEVKRNRADSWFWREMSQNGQVKSVSESYASKANAVRAAAVRAAKAKVDETPGSTLRIVD